MLNVKIASRDLVCSKYFLESWTPLSTFGAMRNAADFCPQICLFHIRNGKESKKVFLLVKNSSCACCTLLGVVIT